MEAKSKNKKAKLTYAQVENIRTRLINKKRGDVGALAKEYGVSLCTIRAIELRRVYK